MPAIGALLASVAASVAGVVSGIAAALSSVVAGIASAIGGVISAIGAVLGNTLVQIGSGIYSIVKALTVDLMAPIGSLVGDIAGTIGVVVGNLAGGLAQAIAGITLPVTKTVTSQGRSLGDALKHVGDGVVKTIRRVWYGMAQTWEVVFECVDKTATVILTPIKGGLEAIYGMVQKLGQGIKTAFHPSARYKELITENPGLWDLAEHSQDTFLMLLEQDGIITSTEAFLVTLPDVYEVLHTVGTLKVLDDLLKGQTDVSQALMAVGQGEAGQILAAIVHLSKNIVTASVELLDYVDGNVSLLRQQIDALDETMRSSLSRRIEVAEAAALAAVTPKLAVIDDRQLKLNRDISRLSRHLEDESWFAYMLLRVLR